MPVNSPGPDPARGIYGFALFLACILGSTTYIIWAWVPDDVLHSMGLTYWPDKYWAVAIPMYFFLAVLHFFIFVFGYNKIVVDPVFDSVEEVVDPFRD